MKNNVKNYLSNIIKETVQSQQDEMARRSKKVRDPKKKYDHPYPVWSNDNPTELDGEGTPDGWYIDPSWFPGKFQTTEPFVAVPLDCDELETLKSRYSEWFKEFEDNGVPIEFVSCNRTSSVRAVEKVYSIGHHDPDKPKPEKMPASERMKRYGVFNILQEFFTNKENLEVFNQRSVPVVVWQEKGQSTSERRKRMNQHVEEWTNDKFVVEMHNANAYETGQDFLNAAIARAKGTEDENAKTYHLARQYNTKYGNWSADKKNQKYWEGYTDIIGIEKRGFTEKNLDVTVRMDFKLVGERTGPSNYMFSLLMTNRVGKKLREENGIKDGFLDDKQIAITKNVQLDPNKTYSDEFPITDDIAVSQGLVEVMSEFMEKLKSIKPQQILKIASMPSSFQPVDNNLQEQKERLVQRITNKLKSL